MNLGNFSISLAVRDIHAAKAFYAQLGFAEHAGNIDQGWLILKNGSSKVGLFQGMFERNMLTFNPGWDSDGAPTPEYDDVRAIQQRLRAGGIEVGPDIATDSGPAHIMLTDPDGNPVLIDQHR